MPACGCSTSRGVPAVPNYVRTVVSCYNEAIDACLAGDFTDEKIADWDQRLATVFNRGFWNGYYLGQRLGEWTHNYGSAATKRKVYIGKGVKYFSNLGGGRVSARERVAERRRRGGHHRAHDRSPLPQGRGDTGRPETGPRPP